MQIYGCLYVKSSKITFYISQSSPWSAHTQAVCTKANQFLGLLYCRFHQSTNVAVVLVRPLQLYGHSFCTATKLHLRELLRMFVLWLIYHAWSMGYEGLLRLSTLPTLEERRAYILTKLSLLYQILNGLCYFSPRMFTLCTSVIRHHASYSFTLYEPLFHTTSFEYAFVLHTIALWNSSTTSFPTLSCFKNHAPLRLMYGEYIGGKLPCCLYILWAHVLD